METDLRDVQFSNSMEEADGRIMLHVKDSVVHGAKKILIRSTDTDVVVLAVSFFHTLERLGLEELWVLYGSSQNRQFIAVHSIALVMGEGRTVALRGFHAFSGSDRTSFFTSKGKKTAWKFWSDSFTEAFKSISLPSNSVPDETIRQTLEKYIVQLYGVQDDQCITVNNARKHLFATENKPLCLIPPTSAALWQHILRTAYQAGQ